MSTELFDKVIVRPARHGLNFIGTPFESSTGFSTIGKGFNGNIPPLERRRAAAPRLRAGGDPSPKQQQGLA
jgi:hypothetical protein